MLVLALRGTAFLFQGEELGLPDAVIPAERIVDVDGRDPERAPIPWERPSEVGPGAGFTTGDPWLPLVGDAESLCVEAQEQRCRFRVDVHADAARAPSGQRRAPARHAAVPRCAGRRPRFVRDHDGERLLVALNFTSAPATVELGERAESVVLSTDPGRPAISRSERPGSRSAPMRASS